MRLRTIVLRLVGLAASSFALGAVIAQPADARSAGAILGLAAASNMACLVIDTATLRNNCGHTVSVDIPLPVDSAGAKAVTVVASALNSTSGVRCRADGTNSDANTHSFSNGGNYTNASSFGTCIGCDRADINLGAVTVAYAGQLLVNCQIEDGSMLLTERWDP